MGTLCHCTLVYLGSIIFFEVNDGGLKVTPPNILKPRCRCEPGGWQGTWPKYKVNNYIRGEIDSDRQVITPKSRERSIIFREAAPQVL